MSWESALECRRLWRGKRRRGRKHRTSCCKTACAVWWRRAEFGRDNIRVVASLELSIFQLEEAAHCDRSYKDLGIHTYVRDVREDKLPQQNEGSCQHKKSEKLQRNKTYVRQRTKIQSHIKKTALPAQLYPLNHFHHIQLLWQMQPKDLAGLSKTNRVLGEGHTRTRTNKTIWHYFYRSTVLIASLREIKDFLRAHKENQLKQHILTPCGENKEKNKEIKMFFYLFPQKTYIDKSHRVGWVKKQDTTWSIFNLLNSLLKTNALLIPGLSLLFTLWIFFHSCPRQWYNHSRGSYRPAAIIFRKTTTAQNWNISR